MMTEGRSAGGRCPACQSGELYYNRTSAKGSGGHGPDLLQGLGRLFNPAKLEIYLCADCGHMEFFADAQAMERVRDAQRWQKLD